MTGYMVILTLTVVIAVSAIGWLLVQTNKLEQLYDGFSASTQSASVNGELMESLNDMIGTYRSILYVIAAAIIVAVVIDIIVALRISRSISRPIKNLVTAANKIALGDVDVSTEIKGNDETAELGQAFQKVIDSFKHQADVLDAIADGDYTVNMDVISEKDIVGRAILEILDKNTELISQIQRSAEEVSSGSLGISAGAQSLATGSNEQAATIDQLSSTIGQVKNQAEDTMTHAIKVDDGIKKVRELTGESSERMNDLMAAMDLIDESSNEIAKVIKVIDDIAFQTNILALNAAVEAARAGQHGKGFAVVADEVRVLASKSAEAARETADLISSSYEKVQTGSELAKKSSTSMFEISDIVNANLSNVTTMRNAAEKQTVAITDINSGVNQITKVVNENSSTAEESAAASEELTAQSEMLKESIRKFKIDNNHDYHISETS